jgi:hypothetical protein
MYEIVCRKSKFERQKYNPLLFSSGIAGKILALVVKWPGAAQAAASVPDRRPDPLPLFFPGRLFLEFFRRLRLDNVQDY